MPIQYSRLKFVLWLSFFYAAGALVAGRILQHVYHILPCPLCLYQQFILVLLAVSVPLIAWALKKGFNRRLIALAPFILLINFALAFYHVGVEQKIFPLPSQCHGDLAEHDGSIESLRNMLLETDIVPCDKVKWKFLGLSMASYNALLSLLILLMWVGAWKAQNRRKI